MHCCHALSVVLARLSCNVLCCKKIATAQPGTVKTRHQVAGRVYRDTISYLRRCCCCSSSDEDERYEASPATTSESSKSPATAEAVLMFALKGNTKSSDQRSTISLPVFLLQWTVAMLCCI